MILKYYAEVPNLKEAVDYYSNLFMGNVEKDAENGHHSKVMMFNQIGLLLHNQSDKNTLRDKPGYYVIKFEDKEVQLFKDAIKHVQKSKDIVIEFELTKGSWNSTSFYQFKDKYGHHWVFEINSVVL